MLFSFPSAIELAELNGDSGFAINGVAIGEESGCSVSTAGDVNQDGIDDILIGACDGLGGRSRTGITYVVPVRKPLFFENQKINF